MGKMGIAGIDLPTFNVTKGTVYEILSEEDIGYNTYYTIINDINKPITFASIWFGIIYFTEKELEWYKLLYK